MNKSPTGSLRDNKGKAPVHKVPLELDEAVSMVLFNSSIEGGGKYPDGNWKLGNKHSVPLASLIRHAKKLAGGEEYDPESGMPHSWHIACNAMFLVYYEKHYPELNDLVSTKPSPTVDAVPSEQSEKGPVAVDAAQASFQNPATQSSALIGILGPLLTAMASQQEKK